MEDRNYDKVLEGLNEVKLDVRELKTTVEKSVETKFDEHGRRIENLENNQKWVVFAIIGAVLGSILNLILK